MNNLRVMLPSGAVVSVDYVKPIVENIFNFNGKRRRLIEYARDMKKGANGVSIFLKYEQNFGITSDSVIVGNLANEKVQEILRQIGETGYYDFSQIGEFQKVGKLEDLKIGSEYPPYTSENKNNIFLTAGLPYSPFGNSYNTPIFGSSVPQDIFSSSSGGGDIGGADEEDDLFEDDDSEDI